MGAIGRTGVNHRELCSLRGNSKRFRTAIDDKDDVEGRACILVAFRPPITVGRRTLGKRVNGDIGAIVRDIHLRDTLGDVLIGIDPVPAQLCSRQDGSGGVSIGRRPGIGCGRGVDIAMRLSCARGMSVGCRRRVLIGRGGTIGIAVGLSCARGMSVGRAGDIGVGRCRGVGARLRRPV